MADPLRAGAARAGGRAGGRALGGGALAWKLMDLAPPPARAWSNTLASTFDWGGACMCVCAQVRQARVAGWGGGLKEA